MKPTKGSKSLRKGRTSIRNQHYLITTTVHGKKPFLNHPKAAEIILSSLHWLENQEKISLDAAVVMSEHLHFIAGLRNGSLATIMRSLKSHTAKQINILLESDGPFWQPQYHDHAVRKDEDLNEVVLYILHNPVRAGLVKDFRDYPFWFCRFNV